MGEVGEWDGESDEHAWLLSQLRCGATIICGIELIASICLVTSARRVLLISRHETHCVALRLVGAGGQPVCLHRRAEYNHQGPAGPCTPHMIPR